MASKKDKFILTAKQEVFVTAFIGDAQLDKTEAARITK